ncbi:MAG TPA: tetrathionate reductase family octaheme c-type cytochrome [Anaeromyxobacter sp.]|nr:tetrathionate reductase family octaheme c-type cytochrome [Anaeromyxobacter sp.]
MRNRTKPGLGMGSIGTGAAALAALVLVLVAGRARAEHTGRFERRVRSHFDHASVIQGPFARPEDVTRACLGCHPAASSVMKTAHFTWLGGEVEVPGHPGKTRVGKKNLINNFCISTVGNEKACTKCHAGYGWVDASYDFGRAENVDCLVCHEHGSGYVKGEAGMPEKSVDLLAAARSVGTPGRENCLTCHAYGGGGQAVKHGDLDSSLEHPPAGEDVHMGKHGFLCVDCHGGKDHRLRGRAFSVSVEDGEGLACTDCHTGREHRDERILTHLRSVACQTCHIPSFARRIPTKASWDWSKAGDGTRPEDPHRYLKIKGEFVYEQDAVPEYRWFDLTVNRYLLGDRIDPTQVTPINLPRGSIDEPAAKIWPFKVHRATQPYDVGNLTLLPPVTGGENGYWTNFDWDNAFRLGSKASGLPYSGRYGFTRTEMYWPLSHMVVPKEKALGCTDCHGSGTRLDWKALGYPGDPLRTGGRN